MCWELVLMSLFRSSFEFKLERWCHFMKHYSAFKLSTGFAIAALQGVISHYSLFNAFTGFIKAVFMD
jgi:hypothetical protein